VFHLTFDLPRTQEPQLQRQVGRANFQGVRSGKPEASVRLQLTCPVGPSPKVLASGWIIGGDPEVLIDGRRYHPTIDGPCRSRGGANPRLSCR